jgi:hypothetical protein
MRMFRNVHHPPLQGTHREGDRPRSPGHDAWRMMCVTVPPDGPFTDPLPRQQRHLKLPIADEAGEVAGVKRGV